MKRPNSAPTRRNVPQNPFKRFCNKSNKGCIFYLLTKANAYAFMLLNMKMLSKFGVKILFIFC